MHMAVQSDDTTMDGNEALTFVEGLAEKVAGHDYTLSDAENSALSSIRKFVDRLLKDIVSETGEDQAEVNSIRDLIEGCATSATNSLKQVAALKIAVGAARTQHSDCRVSETKANDKMTMDCAAYDAYCQGKGSDVPACLSSMTSAKFSTGNANSDNSIGSCLEEINEWFPPLWEKYSQCKLSELIHNDKTKECNNAQKPFEGDFCQYDLLLDTTCDTQDDCRSKNIDAREKGHAAVKIAETARSTDCQVGHKVKCLLAIFEEKDNKKKPGMLDSCKARKYSCPDGILYPGIPDPTTCTREPSEPCDSAWLQTEYTSKAWFGKAPAGTCIPCLKPPVADCHTFQVAHGFGFLTGPFSGDCRSNGASKASCYFTHVAEDKDGMFVAGILQAGGAHFKMVKFSADGSSQPNTARYIDVAPPESPAAMLALYAKAESVGSKYIFNKGEHFNCEK